MSQRQLPKDWNLVKISQICSINPSIVIPVDRMDEIVDFVPMDAVDTTTGTIAYREKKQLAQVARGKTRFQVGDILFAKITPCTENGKVALVEYLESDVGYGSTEFYVLRPLRGLLSYYLWHWLRMPSVRNLAVEAMTGSSGRQRVPSSFWREVSIPLPPIPVQHAIVTILNKVDSIRRKQKDLDRIIENLSLSLFKDTFGDPMTNPKKWEVMRLKDVIKSIGGGTPSKKNSAFWDGQIPWVSPKDIKSEEIWDTIDHITEEALYGSSTSLIEPGSVILVVRSGILKHSLPIAINRVPVCINQDLKALTPSNKLTPEYLFAILKHLEKMILSQCVRVGSTVHNIDSKKLFDMNIMLPPILLQRAFSDIFLNYRGNQQGITSYIGESSALSPTILTRAFTGELTAEWEAANAEIIAAEIARLEQRPRLALLDLIALRQQRHPEAVGITRLMKYTFLAQKQGEVLSQPTNHLYDFVPYHFGPFAQDLYDDLTTLETEDWIRVERAADTLFDTPERTDILLNPDRTAELEVELTELSDAERADLAAVVDKYGSLSHKELLDTVYSQYPAYARKSRLRRSHS